MAEPEYFDILVLGDGAGGHLIAWHLAAQGKSVAVIERKLIGGSCPNIACLPSKNEIYSANVAHTVRHAAQFGTITGSVSIDMETVRRRKRAMVDRMIAGHLEYFQTTSAELILGSGKFVAPKTLEVHLNNGGLRTLTAKQIFLNVGTHATVPNIAGLAEAQPMTHVELLDVNYVPNHLIVLGGGYVGMEFAQAFRRFGSQVTVLERGSQVLSHEDRDVADEVRAILTAEGVHFLMDTEVSRVEGRSGEEVKLTVRTGHSVQMLDGTDILVAAGRTPNTRDIGLEKLGVELDEHGYIKTNERLETTVSDIWAIGECAGSPHFTHISVDDFHIIKANLAGGKRTKSDRVVPYCLFVDPPLAHVGLTEIEATRKGIPVRIAKLPIENVLRAATMDATRGFMKALISTKDDSILGFTMIGDHAGEVMAVVEMAMIAGMSYTSVADAILTHPTMAEGLGILFSRVPPRAMLRAA